MTHLDNSLRLAAYLLGLSSYFLLIYSFGFNFKTVRQRLRIARKIRENLYERKWKQNHFFKRYHKLLTATIPKYKRVHLFNLINIQLLSMLFLSISFWLVTHSVLFSILSPFLITIIFPVTMLYLRLLRIRHNSHADLYPATVKLLQFYQKNGRNMFFALKELSQHLTNKDLKFVYSMLFIRLQNPTDGEDRQIVSETFAYQVGGEWGRNLSITILKAIEGGIDVSGILQDITFDMSTNQKIARDAESDGREIARIGYLPIFLIPITIVINAQFLMVENAYYYHFKTPLGLKALVISIIAALIGLGMAYVLSKPKQSL